MIEPGVLSENPGGVIINEPGVSAEEQGVINEPVICDTGLPTSFP